MASTRSLAQASGVVTCREASTSLSPSWSVPTVQCFLATPYFVGCLMQEWTSIAPSLQPVAPAQAPVHLF